MNVNTIQFTWRNKYLKLASRLDYWLVDNFFLRKVVNTDIRPAIRADNNIISLNIKIKSVQKGPGYWKLNSRVFV